jgi:hypothetical protein
MRNLQKVLEEKTRQQNEQEIKIAPPVTLSLALSHQGRGDKTNVRNIISSQRPS